jgi:hypothetical protein
MCLNNLIVDTTIHGVLSVSKLPSACFESGREQEDLPHTNILKYLPPRPLDCSSLSIPRWLTEGKGPGAGKETVADRPGNELEDLQWAGGYG